MRSASDAVEQLNAQLGKGHDDAETAKEIQARLGLSLRKISALLHMLEDQGRLRSGYALRPYLGGAMGKKQVYWVEDPKEKKK